MSVYRRAAGVIEASIGDDLVALDVQSGDCFALNEVAASVWRNLSESKSFEELRHALLDDYEVPIEQCTRELQELLDDLVQAELVEKVD